MKRTVFIALAFLSCATAPLVGADQSSAPGPWRSLLEDHSAPAWRGWKEPGLPAGWHVEGGVLTKDGKVDDLVTNDSFGNFELELEWMTGKAGNSGIFYRGTREYDHIYWSAPEYQLLDDENTEDGKSRLTAAGSVYALYGVPAGVVAQFDHWNTTRLVVKGNHVEHWLNGKKVVAYDLKSADWKSRVAASKFSAYPNYGLAAAGLIGIQGDHPGTLAIRAIRIREWP
jgi:hypothetical protein